MKVRFPALGALGRIASAALARVVDRLAPKAVRVIATATTARQSPSISQLNTYL